MLSQLSIQDFAIVDQLDLDLTKGMTVVSGETGAGKSIMLDALGLALGNRSDSGEVRYGTDKADITAVFDLTDAPEAKAWLVQQELDAGDECILRRVITKEGRSRCYINGRPSPIATVKALRGFLIDIHGQHEHQRLMSSDHHRVLLDAFNQNESLLSKVQRAFRQWQNIEKQWKDTLSAGEQQSAQIQLLKYQIEELNELAPQDGEVDTLEAEQKQLESAESILQAGHWALGLASESDDGNCLALISQCQQILAKLGDIQQLGPINELFDSAQIQLEEGANELSRYLDTVDVNPARLAEVESRLSALYDMARKHKVAVKELPQFLADRQTELARFENASVETAELETQAKAAQNLFFETAQKLSKAREKAANTLAKAVNKQLQALGMKGASLSVALTPLDTGCLHGLEAVEFLISTNKGQPPKPLSKVASGGELSRVSLAIQVVTAASCATPTLIFDEVDVGIGGAIAEVVGKLMRQLGERAQVLCVTHQPQVASQGHKHLFVSKSSSSTHTRTKITRLQSEHRVQEIARMLGGIEITNRSLEHAKEMLGQI